jgi:hypothetical protein
MGQDDPEAPWRIRNRMLKAMGWRPGTSEMEWRRILADRIFKHRRIAPEDRTAFAVREEEERKAWIQSQRKIQHGWAKWMRWRNQSPHLADAYRRDHQAPGGGDRDWLIEFASVRVPRAPVRRQKPGRAENRGVDI